LSASRRPYAVFFALVVAIAVAAALVGRRRHETHDVLAAVPREAWLLATVDVEALRPSPIAQAIVGTAGVTVPGLGPLVDACGFEPLAHLSQVALVAPEADGEFGVAFAGDLDRAALSACADKILRARGGDPVTETHGSFTLVGDARDPKRTRLAYRDGGPFLVGRGAWLLAMIDAVDGKAPRASAELLALRASLARPPASGAGAGEPRALVVAALLPKSTRDRLKAEIETHEGSEGAEPSGAYAGVLGVDRAGFSLSTGAAGSTTYASVELHCESAEACAAVKELVERKRFAASSSPAFRLLGLGPAIDSLAVEAQGPALSLSAHEPTDTLARLTSRIVANRP
jgi:hypothetical protein